MSNGVFAYETPNGTRYRARYRRPDHRQTSKTGFKTRQEAEDFLATLPRPEQRRNVLDRERFAGGSEFDELMREYRHHRRARGESAGTTTQRLLHMETLHGAYPDVLAVTTEDLELFLSRRRNTHKPESRRSMRSSWQQFYAWAWRRGLIDEDPAADVQPVRIPRTVARIANDDDVIRSLDTATMREKAMILLGRLAALRLAEITQLHTSDREGDVLRVRGKGGHIRMVPINDELLDVLERLEKLHGDGYYFPGRYGGTMHPQSINKIIHRVVGTNPHSLRHAAATAAYEGTHDLRAVQEMLGHSSLATTERYLHVRVDQIRAAANAAQLGIGTQSTTAVERAAMSTRGAGA